MKNNGELHRILMTRRDIFRGAAAGALALWKLLYSEPASAQEKVDFRINRFISKEPVHLGSINLTEAAENVQFLSDGLNFPPTPQNISTFTRYDAQKLAPGQGAVSCIQSAVYPDYPVIFFGDSGIYRGNDLIFEGLRSMIEGEYFYDIARNEYIAQFVGPVQQQYRIKTALSAEPAVTITAGLQSEEFTVSGINILPNRSLDKTARKHLFDNGNVKLSTCGTSAVFAVIGAGKHCERLNIHGEREIREALHTLGIPDAGGHDIYEAMLTIYAGIKQKDPVLAGKLLAVYSRQKEMPSGGFINLTEDEIKAMGFDFFSSTHIIASGFFKN